MERIVKTAGVQLAATLDREKNLSRAAMLIELAADEGAKIIALPQLFHLRWFPHVINQKGFALAETADGRTVTFLRELA
ncbi:MAG: acyltransferase, partial [Deltaproteobacteria bacterium]|nr:acyltransferase [Deltaproteobacteria bacterium]